VHDLITELKYLETLQIINNAELSKLMTKIESTSHQLFIQLEKEVAYLKQEVHV